ncbi:MAG: histidine--tRNA ligase [Breznakiellaceae bacterium]
MAQYIEPRVLKGFRDFLPPAEIERRLLIEKIEQSFRLFGFVPIDTPALEYAEILLGKGGGETEKQIYRFKDHGERDVALRFDLTVPFARFMAEHRHELPLPFKRYHIAKVWRGENTQRGRYREFTQCDFDIVGTDKSAADFEILLMMKQTLSAIGVQNITIRLNHRGLFNRFLHRFGWLPHSVEILRTVDKLAKIGEAETRDLLANLVGQEGAATILSYIHTEGSYEETLRKLTDMAGGKDSDTERLETLLQFMKDLGIESSFVLDPSITRGLDYYTGVVFETFLNDLPDIGSVCSGGRYDNLVALYSREQLPGVGASIGLDRLLAALEALGKETAPRSFVVVAIACVDERQGGRYQALAQQFRAAGLACEVFPEPKKLSQQFALAEKKGARFMVIPQEGESSYTLRDLSSRENKEHLSVDEMLKLIRQTGLVI